MSAHTDLAKMMFQVGEILVDDNAQRYGFLVADSAFHLQLVGRYAAENVGQVQVIYPPEFDQVGP